MRETETKKERRTEGNRKGGAYRERENERKREREREDKGNCRVSEWEINIEKGRSCY